MTMCVHIVVEICRHSIPDVYDDDSDACDGGVFCGFIESRAKEIEYLTEWRDNAYKGGF